MIQKFIKNFNYLSAVLFGMLTLIQCSGMSGSPGGTAPGGAVGEAPGGGTVATGGTSGTPGSAPGGAALPISGPVSAASGSGSGVLSAPVEDDFMGDCDPKAMLFHGKDYASMFDPDLEKPFPWNLVAGNPFLGQFAVVGMGGTNLTGMQVRAVHIAHDKSAYTYRDFLLKQGVPPFHPITVEVESVKLENGDRIEVYYYPLRKSKVEGSDDSACLPFKTASFSETWVALSPAKYNEIALQNFMIELAAIQIQILYKVDRPALPEFDFKILSK